MYIGRKEDGIIYGMWTVRQWEGQEELPDADAAVVEFVETQTAKMNVPQLTIEDIVAVLPQASKDALASKLGAK